MARAIFLCALLVFLFSLSENVMTAPKIRVLEFAVCFDYFTGREPGSPGPIKEQQCKIAPIQQQLAVLRAWLGALEALPSKQEIHSRLFGS
jgi:hypothetical protein